jgi:hypothetical protein
MRSLLRILYQTIIQMHPASFRGEFGEEMLWIFDEESPEGNAVRMLLDGMRSIVLQHAKSRGRESAGLFYREVNSTTSLLRFAQAGFIVVTVILFVSLLSGPLVPKLASPAYTASGIGHAGEGRWLLSFVRSLSMPSAKSAKI